jgi:hypothetical protein
MIQRSIGLMAAVKRDKRVREREREWEGMSEKLDLAMMRLFSTNKTSVMSYTLRKRLISMDPSDAFYRPPLPLPLCEHKPTRVFSTFFFLSKRLTLPSSWSSAVS